MKKSTLIQIKKILCKWLIEESQNTFAMEYDQCELELLELTGQKDLTELLMDRCNSETATAENISSKVEEIIETWEDEILNAEYECEPDYFLN